EPFVLATLGPGEVVGEVSLVLRRPSTADVVAVHPTVTLHLSSDKFMSIVREHPAILAELYELAVRRDDETRSIVAQESTSADEYVPLCGRGSVREQWVRPAHTKHSSRPPRRRTPRASRPPSGDRRARSPECSC